MNSRATSVVFGQTGSRQDALLVLKRTYDYFAKKKVWPGAQHVSAQAWSPTARDSDEVMEEVFVMEAYGSVLSLVWWPAR